jgi:hypothetical protein
VRHHCTCDLTALDKLPAAKGEAGRPLLFVGVAVPRMHGEERSGPPSEDAFQNKRRPGHERREALKEGTSDESRSGEQASYGRPMRCKGPASGSRNGDLQGNGDCKTHGSCNALQ